MRIALVADLHGNWPAVQAMERDIARRGADEIYCLGDLVGKGPSSDKTCDWAFANCSVILGGNWDLGVAQRAFPKDEFYWNQLGNARLQKLAALPLEHHFDFSGLHVRLLHGRPVTPDLVHPESERAEFEQLFERDGEQFDLVGGGGGGGGGVRSLRRGYIFNTGSVGNAIGRTGVHYALIEGEMGPSRAPFALSLIHLDYDVEAALADALGAGGLPGAQAYMNELKTGIYSRKMPKNGG